MGVLKKNELAALGLVNRRPMHGYALSQAIRRVHLEHWSTLSRSSIYAALRRLQRQGAVSLSHEREGRAPERTVYHITPRGRDMLHELLCHALGYVGPDDRYFYLGLAFADALAPEELIPLLRRRKASLVDLVHAAREECDLHATNLECERRYLVMMRAGLRHLQLEIDVCDEVIQMLHSAPETFGECEEAGHES